MPNPEFDDELQETQELVRRRQRYFRKPQTAQALVAKVMTRRSVAATNAEGKIIQAWTAALNQQTIASAIADKTRPTQVRRAVLEVVVADSATLQQLAFVKHKLIQQINAADLVPAIKDIRFQIGVVDSK